MWKRLTSATILLCILVSATATVQRTTLRQRGKTSRTADLSGASRRRRRAIKQYVVILDKDIPSVEDFIKLNLNLAQFNTLGDLDDASMVRTTDIYEQVKGFTIRAPERIGKRLVRYLRRVRGVKLVQESRLYTIDESQTNPPWGLDRIDQIELAPPSHTYNYNNKGEEVNVYILDTGINIAHGDFTGRASVAFDSVDDDDDSHTPSESDRGGGVEDGLDCNGHGTHVAGIVGGRKYGVAKGVTIFSVRVIGRNTDGELDNCGRSGISPEIVKGIDRVIKMHKQLGKPSVINMSFGGDFDATVNLAVVRAIEAKIVCIASAGNNHQDHQNHPPSNAPGVIPVGATDGLDRRWGDSNYGRNLIFAPGVAIPSAGYLDNEEDVTKSGTSMAAPHVAGVAALYLHDHHGATPAVVSAAIRSNASVGKVSNIPPGTSTPNLLLYSIFGNHLPALLTGR